MAEDYYKILGINRNASEADVQQADRRVARSCHPDLNPDDKDAKRRFQEVQKAFDVLSDPNKRELYDRYGSSFEHAGAGGNYFNRGRAARRKRTDERNAILIRNAGCVVTVGVDRRIAVKFIIDARTEVE